MSRKREAFSMGQTIDGYIVSHRLGKGGMGTVYAVSAPDDQQLLALKILDPFEVLVDVLGMQRLREMFAAEAMLMSRLSSPAVVRVHDQGEDENGRPYFVMEYLCRNLGEMLGEGFWMDRMSRVIPPHKVIHYGRQLVAGLFDLHQCGVIHRDIKPYNLLVDGRDRIRIFDFGMALDRGRSLAASGSMIIGSPFYCAPEQAIRANQVDGRADLYSAAVVMFRMLTGLFPSQRLFPLDQHFPGLDGQWDRFFQQALRRDPEARFRDGEEMVAAIDRIDRQALSKAVADPWPGWDRFVTGPRSQAEDIGGSMAFLRLGLSEQYQPLWHDVTHLEVAKNGQEVVAPEYGLIWRRHPSRQQLTLSEAAEYLDWLNRQDSPFPGRWRLPTISELLTLVRPDPAGYPARFFAEPLRWLWSGDRHGAREQWYLDTQMGFAAPLDRHCRNQVLAVRFDPRGAPVAHH